MIRVRVEEYCHACLDFCPDVTKPNKVMLPDGDLVLGDTVIQCEYRKRCENIRKYLMRQDYTKGASE